MERAEVVASVHAIWVAVLGADELGLDEDFFELGGHSLLAIDLLEQIRERHGVKLTMQDLHRHTTVNALADRIMASR